MGTRIENLALTKVVDGDTVKVMLDDTEESLRLAAIDTEESLSGSSKPITAAGRAASEFAKSYFSAAGGGLATVDIEFDTDDPVEVCLRKHRGNYGRLICYVFKDGENYNHRTIAEGWSPYFSKYGRSRLYHDRLVAAEASAQPDRKGVWNPEVNAGGPSRDYGTLLPWWGFRASLVEDFRRRGAAAGALSVRLDYDAVAESAANGDSVTVFCDLQGGIDKRVGGGAVIFAGSQQHRFNLWIPDAETPTAQRIIRAVEGRYAGRGRGYIYVSGEASEFRGTPQIVLSDRDQFADAPPGG